MKDSHKEADSSASHAFPPHLLALLAGLTLGWGLNWSATKMVLSEMAPMPFRTLCLLCGGVGLLAIARAGGHRIRVPKGQWPRLVAIGLVNLGAWNIFASYGVRLLASGRAAILGYTMPAWSVLLSAWLLGEPLTRRRVLGVALGCGGVILLFGSEFRAVGRSPAGAFLMLIAAVSWALGTVLMKRWPVDLPATSFTGWQMLIGVIPIATIAVFFDRGSFNPLTLSLWPLVGVVYNIVVGFNFSYWAWTKIATQAPVGIASLAVMMTPVVGVFSGALLLGEVLHQQDFWALALVVASLATVLLPARGGATAPGRR